MTRGVLWLQVVSVILLTGVIVYVGLGSKRRGRAAGQGTPQGTIDAAQRSPLLHANLGPCLLVLAPVDPDGGVGRVAHSVPGLERSTLLMLRVFHRGGADTLELAPEADRLELRIDRTWTAPLGDLRGALERPDVSESTRALLGAFVPTELLRFQDHAMGRILFSLDRAVPWSRIEAARYRLSDGETIRFAPVSITLVELDSLLSGGPIPDALDAPPQRTSSLTAPKGEVK